MAKHSLDEETTKKVIRQVEFYFSDSNLPRDDFLSKTVNESEDGSPNVDNRSWTYALEGYKLTSPKDYSLLGCSVGPLWYLRPHLQRYLTKM